MKRLYSHSFTKSQIAAFIATAVDFLCLILLVEILAVWYVASTAIAALIGAIVNFLLGRHWSFPASNEILHKQAIRYFWVALGSLLLNIAGVFALTELLDFQYLISKSLTAILVGFAFNYPLHRYYVFKLKTAT